MQVIHHGGKDTVTGSCHELRLDDQSILIDCGLFQGADSRNLEIDFSTRNIVALLLTHSHIDHVGRIPWLLAKGFEKPIICTKATAELLPLMLTDGLKIQGLNNRQTERVLRKVKRMVIACEYNEWIAIPTPFKMGVQLNNGKDHSRPNTLYARFQPAGHILGSAYIEVKLPNQEVIVFSGDLGPSHTPLLPDPLPPERADYLFIESTYGDRQHDDIATRGQRLKKIIERSLRDGGTILIPAFSVGRTQELLFDIEQLIYQHDIDISMPIILDSPMASKVTRSYQRFKKLWGNEAKAKLEAHRHPLEFEQCITVEDYRTHQRLVNRLASTGEPTIVVAASGMCQGGRIMAYLKALLSDKRTDVIFAGYQADGTLGAELQSGTSEVEIDGEMIKVKAQLHTMSGYSAHADKNDLMEFVCGIANKPKEIHLIHGVPKTKSYFAKELKKQGFDVR
ncbi:MBL fold metallo-hydrolase RNA specificity domain-containing protein [Vibrio maerlii]|uniref:MBL fold metallo-hydrolase RNA specificity domain-containing protein n=1 Tax=Vibrio maerlii TaxID=2231648 RepID=UPI000E3CE70E|nr:MBL fold metallo-hydrolase [Vibrio maerlii]